jgi:hypothetical protein
LCGHETAHAMPADEGILPWMALRVDLWRLATSKSRFRAGEAFASIPPNAALEWQTRSLGWRS